MENKTFKYLGFFVVIVTVFLLGILVGHKYIQVNRASDGGAEQNSPQTASLMIDYGNGTVATYKVLPITGTTTVFDALKFSADAHKFAVRSKDYGGDMGVFIESIDAVGKDPAGKKWWQYWVNNTYGQVSTSLYVLKAGDVVELKFISEQ